GCGGRGPGSGAGRRTGGAPGRHLDAGIAAAVGLRRLRSVRRAARRLLRGGRRHRRSRPGRRYRGLPRCAARAHRCRRLAHRPPPARGYRPAGSPRTEILARLRSARSAGVRPPNDDFLYGTAGAIVAHAGLLQAADAFGLTAADVAAIRDQLAMLGAGLASRRAAAASAGRPAPADGSGGAPEPAPDYGFAHGAAGVGYGFLVGGVTLADE